ncbi:MAG: 4-alpha-glucanotransferase [Acetobacteraceae bacterium]|nr:4-alpha-glucanotransferase [Acetobacteraceae bacterium]
MSETALRGLAERAGIAPYFRDAFANTCEVSPQTLRAVLLALGLPAHTTGEISDSEAQLAADERDGSLPPLLTAQVGETLRLAGAGGRFRITLEDGGVIEGTVADGALAALPVAGYHRLEIGETVVTIATAPSRCVSVRDTETGGRPWGIAAQLYSLRRHGDGGIGDFAALADFARSAARHGASAVAISPVHAQFSADPDRFSPYAPSSRVMLNALHIPLPDDGNADCARLEALDMIDWPAAGRARLASLRRLYEAESRSLAFETHRRARGETLENHARFEALHAHFFGQDPARWHWRTWPDEFREPGTHAVSRFAEEHADEVGFHAWLQFRAEQELAQAHAAARHAGMAIGLISDLAVGTDAGGSHAWSHQEQMLIGLTVGAPPDQLALDGQDWGLVTFSPRGLRKNGYAAFIDMVRAALRHAGGVRIDHVMGLNRLWVLPEGADAREGAYLRFPEQDLLRLVALESHRHCAIVLGEDLGTVPEGFSERLCHAGILGLRVVWFERDGERFKPPAIWTPDAAAMTSTHDVPTIAGWWRGHDLDWRVRLGLVRDIAHERVVRERDRTALWQAFRDSGAAGGDPPPPADIAEVVDAAVRHIGRAACDLVLLPAEDALGLTEQPNLPGTVDEHPNWRRRLPEASDVVLDARGCRSRLAALCQWRG